MYESPRVEFGIHAYLPDNILNFKVDSLSLFFNRISVTSLTIHCYPELQRKTLWTLDAFPLSNNHSFLNRLITLTRIWRRQPCNLITTLKVFSTSLDLFRWGHSYHTLTAPFVGYPSLATPELLLQISYSSCSDSHSNVQDFMDSNKILSGQTSAALLWFLHSI